jgi:hypothetical protein
VILVFGLLVLVFALLSLAVGRWSSISTFSIGLQS